MAGGAGDDTFIVQDAADVVIEAAGGGTDHVLASVDFSLAENVENLTLTGTAAIHGAGNGLANILNGNAGANHLGGGGGDDVLIGGGGADRLTGGAGNDRFSYLIKADSIASDRDVITDFSPGDQVDLSGLDGNTGLPGRQASWGRSRPARPRALAQAR